VLQLAREEATPQQLADIDAELHRLGVAAPARRVRQSSKGQVSHAPSWMMRSDRSKASWVWAEATAGRLRQGWGYQPKQDLNLLRDRRDRGGDPFDRHDDLAWPNRRMLDDEPDGMQIGDLVLLPHLPVEWHWAVVRITGPYRYEIDPVQGDYGHILPAAVVLADLTDAALTDELRRMRTYPARLRRLSDEAYRDLQSVVASVSDR
jgi:hypothetical protein